ncbi:MAG: hemin uptake protein HemP [Burkholderiaceae bacterium]
MSSSSQNDGAIISPTDVLSTDATAKAVMRINSQELFRQRREVEIEHDGKTYRLRITQLNKLILTA